MPMPPIWAFVFDDENEDEFARHGIYPEQVAQVLTNRHRLERNKGSRRASHLLIGVDDGGTCLTIPIERTRERGLWRPVIAWRCSTAERGRLAP